MKDIFKYLIDSAVNDSLSKASEEIKKLNDKKDVINRIIDNTVNEIKKESFERREREQSSFSEKIYTDEPILFVASKMKNYTPKEILEMRKLERNASWSAMSDPGMFYKQAKLMENYEDDYEFTGDFQRFYPTYRSMSLAELRGYFSWRSKVRRGEIVKTSLSFVFVYIYELLNLIGCENEFEGYNKLIEIFDSYGAIDKRILQYKKNWVNDFIVYYDLPKELYLQNESDGGDFENALITLENYEDKTDTEIFEALCAFSSYNIKATPFYREYESDVVAVTAKLYKKLSLYHKKHRKTSLIEKLFGKSFQGSYFMFNVAVFYEREKHPDAEYAVNGILKYTCKNGSWYQERTFKIKGKNAEIREILKNIDCLMREKFNFKHKLTRVESTKLMLDMINECIDERIKENKENEKKVINIDLSKLQNIRDVSLITQNKLIVEEEVDISEENLTFLPEEEAELITETENEVTEIIKDTAQTKEENPDITNETDLSDDEFKFTSMLVRDENYKEYLKSRGIMLSVIIDSVNEKLFDVFGDTVIDFDGETPEIIEDYIDELKGLLKI